MHIDKGYTVKMPMAMTVTLLALVTLNDVTQIEPIQNCVASPKVAKGHTHRYQKSKLDCLRFVLCPLLAPDFQGFFFVVAINSTNEANKAESMRL